MEKDPENDLAHHPEHEEDKTPGNQMPEEAHPSEELTVGKGRQDKAEGEVSHQEGQADRVGKVDQRLLGTLGHGPLLGNAARTGAARDA